MPRTTSFNQYLAEFLAYAKQNAPPPQPRSAGTFAAPVSAQELTLHRLNALNQLMRASAVAGDLMHLRPVQSPRGLTPGVRDDLLNATNPASTNWSLPGFTPAQQRAIDGTRPGVSATERVSRAAQHATRGDPPRTFLDFLREFTG